MAVFLVLVFGYVFAATYCVKLIPLYGGYAERTSLAGLARLYSHRRGALAANLDAVALSPWGIIFALATVAVVLVGAQQIC